MSIYNTENLQATTEQFREAVADADWERAAEILYPYVKTTLQENDFTLYDWLGNGSIEHMRTQFLLDLATEFDDFHADTD